MGNLRSSSVNPKYGLKRLNLWQSGPEDSTSKYGRALRVLAACGHQEGIKRSTSSQMHYGDYSSPAARSQESRIQDIGPASSFFACLLTAAAALSLFSLTKLNEIE